MDCTILEIKLQPSQLTTQRLQLSGIEDSDTLAFLAYAISLRPQTVFDSQTGKVIISRDVIFDESHVNFKPSSPGGTTNQIQHISLYSQNNALTDIVSDINQNFEHPTQNEPDSVELVDCEDTSNSSPTLDPINQSTQIDTHTDHETLECNKRP